MESRTAIEESKKDFQSLIREGGLPPKMQVKLRYLLTAIQGNEEDYTLVDELPQFQKMSLQMMDKSTKVSLFNSIVKCLAGRQVLIYFSAEKATLKTESSSASSLTCYLSGTSQALKIAKNKEGSILYYQMSMEKLMVSKIYRQQKKKYSFGIEYEGVRYRVRFQEQGQCARIHGALLTIIRQKRSMKAKQLQKQGESSIKKQEGQDDMQFNYEAKMLQQEKQYLLTLRKRVQTENLQNTQKFQLVRNTQWGKILVNRKENQLKILMFLQVCNVANLIQSYIQFGAWNTQVENFRVLNKIRRNTYLCSLMLKRKALTAPRHAFFTVSYFKECSCLVQNKGESSQNKRDKHYLLLKSVDKTEHLAEQKGSYLFTIDQIVEFSKVQGQNSCVFINLKSKIDFNVYEYLNSSLDKSLDFLGEIGSITLLSRERDLLKNNKKELFQFGFCICQLKIPEKLHFQEDTQTNSELKQSITSDLQSSRKKVVEESVSEWQLKDIFQVLDNHNNKLLIEKKILQLMKKKVHQQYYLKQRFDLDCHQEPYISSQYRLKEIQNFFQLGSSWKLNSSQDLVFIDDEIIKMQKGALKLIIKQITSNLMAGKSILSMSLPVELFSDDSALQGFARTLGFVPYYMNQATKQTEVVEQIKYVAAAWFFIFACRPQVTKPFNPILGETFQGILGGIPVYFQQISHHPPISSFYMKNDKFQAYGNFDIMVDLGMNSAYTKFPTTFTVKIFNTNSEYCVRYPDVEVGGIMFGDRTLKTVGKSYILQKKSGVYLQLSIGKAKKGLYEYKQKIRHADLVGGIFQIAPATIERLQNIEKKKSVEGIKPQQALKKYSLITGKWYGDLSFDGVSIKSFKNGPFPVEMQRPSVLLPSDCTYRQDIIYRRWRDYKTSNEQKEVLENLQRKERKARQKTNPKKH